MTEAPTPSDVAFDLFMATVEYEDMTRWEQRAYAWHKEAENRLNYDPQVEAEIAAYKLRKHGKAA